MKNGLTATQWLDASTRIEQQTFEGRSAGKFSYEKEEPTTIIHIGGVSLYPEDDACLVILRDVITKALEERTELRSKLESAALKAGAR